MNYLYEHQAEFPGVEIQPRQLRSYEAGKLAPQLLGYVGEITGEQLESACERRLCGRRPDRPDGDRGDLRPLPARARRRRPGAGRRAGPRDERARVQPAAAGRLLGAAHDRRRAPAGRRGRPRLRDPAGARERRVGGGRRRDRRDGSVTTARSSRWPRTRRFDPKTLRRHVSQKELDRAPRPRSANLPDAEPGRQRPLSAGLDVQARHGPRRAPGRDARAVRGDPVRPAITSSTARSSSTGTRTRTSR